jgi:O-methyltransferase
METCKSETMVSREHLHFLSTVIDELHAKDISGSIVECGVWKGGCVMWMMLCQKKYSMLRDFYLYDTFDGMTFPDSNKDAPQAVELYTKISNGEYSREYDKWHASKKWAYAPIDYVKTNISKTEYDESKIHYVAGDVCSTLDTTVPESISILRLDTDWYNSTKKELDILFPRVNKHGYVIVDDYYAWKGSHVATNEFLKDHTKEVTIIDKKQTGGSFVFRKN